MNRIDYDTALEIASHEAIVRQAYRDSVGVWTWSVGLTDATGHKVERYINSPKSLEHCLAVYVWALEKYADDVREELGRDVSREAFAAALSFHWNTGSISRASWVDMFKRGEMTAAERSFLQWNKAGGKVSPGLVTRREREADLMFRDRWSNDGTILEYTRVRANGSIDWSSAKRINIENELQSAMEGNPKEPEPEPSPAKSTVTITAPSDVAVVVNGKTVT